MPLELEELTGKIIGAAIEVHRKLGPGFLESIYENALEIEIGNRGLSVQTQFEIGVLYDNHPVGKHRLDMLVEGAVVVELKAIISIEQIHFTVVRSYLNAMGLRHGLLLNFNKPTLEIKRVLAQGLGSS